MNVIQCVNGHWYDSDAYTTCPHCGAVTNSFSDNTSSNVSANSQGSYSQGNYSQGNYSQGNYSQGNYSQGNYSQGNYSQGNNSQGQINALPNTDNYVNTNQNSNSEYSNPLEFSTYGYFSQGKSAGESSGESYQPYMNQMGMQMSDSFPGQFVDPAAAEGGAFVNLQKTNDHHDSQYQFPPVSGMLGQPQFLPVESASETEPQFPPAGNISQTPEPPQFPPMGDGAGTVAQQEHIQRTVEHQKAKSETLEIPLKPADPNVDEGAISSAMRSASGRLTAAERRSAVSQTLTKMVEQISSNPEGRTMSYFGMVSKSRGEKQPENASNSSLGESTGKAEASESTAGQSGPAEPVVGWLVCISGPNQGRDYRICAGLNSIGRERGNRITVYGDKGISREKHAMVIYEPKKMQFFIKPGESSGLTYLNDEYVSGISVLKNGDLIEMGASRFVFVPLCGETFKWENYIDY